MRVFSALITLLMVQLTLSAAETSTSLPRVLILGDSIYQEPGRQVAAELKGQAEVITAKIDPGEVRNTETALLNLDRYLGEEQWDLIHFNFGLGDLVYRAPGMEVFRVMAKDAGGVRATDPEQYEKNLRELVKRLKQSGAKLVWASTTPIRHSTSGVFEKGSEIGYNAIAARVMSEEGIAINDMYSFAKSLINMDKPASHGADPFHFDRKPLSPPIVSTVLRQLNIELNPKPSSSPK